MPSFLPALYAETSQSCWVESSAGLLYSAPENCIVLTSTPSVVSLCTIYRNCIIIIIMPLLPIPHFILEKHSFDQQIPIAWSCLGLENCTEFHDSSLYCIALSPSKKFHRILVGHRVADLVLILKIMKNYRAAFPNTHLVFLLGNVQFYPVGFLVVVFTTSAHYAFFLPSDLSIVFPDSTSEPFIPS